MFQRCRFSLPYVVLTYVSMADHDFSSQAETPVLLMSEGNSSAAGQAWISVDKTCRLHYSVFVSGLEPTERHLLELLEISPALHLMPSARSVQRVLQKINGDEVRMRGQISFTGAFGNIIRRLLVLATKSILPF